MKSMSSGLRVLAITVALVGGILTRAEATSISIIPANQNVSVGDPVFVDVVVSGLTEATGGFSLQVGFDDAVLTGTSINNDPSGKLGSTVLDLSGFSSGGGFTRADLLYVSFESSATLTGLQGPFPASFTLARILFSAFGNGLSALTLSSVALSNADGTANIAGVTTTNGQVCVGAGCAASPVPEPASMLLFGTGLAGLVVLRRRSVRR